MGESIERSFAVTLAYRERPVPCSVIGYVFPERESRLGLENSAAFTSSTSTPTFPADALHVVELAKVNELAVGAPVRVCHPSQWPVFSKYTIVPVESPCAALVLTVTVPPDCDALVIVILRFMSAN